MMSFGKTNVSDADVGGTVTFPGSTSVNFGSTDVFDTDVGRYYCVYWEYQCV